MDIRSSVANFALLILVAIIVSTNARAEIFKEIYPKTQPDELPTLFPNARINVGRVENQGQFTVTYFIDEGSVNGNVIVFFHDMLLDYGRISSKNSELLVEAIRIGKMKRYDVSSVRYVPSFSIRASQLAKKYGKPSKMDISNSTFDDQLIWSTKGVSAEVRDGKVVSIDYEFTPSDKACEKYLRSGVLCPEKVKAKADAEWAQNVSMAKKLHLKMLEEEQ